MSKSSSSGSFAQEIEQLLDQLESPPVFQLGYPMPQEKYLPQRKQRVGRSPAAHNRALLGQEDLRGSGRP